MFRLSSTTALTLAALFACIASPILGQEPPPAEPQHEHHHQQPAEAPPGQQKPAHDMSNMTHMDHSGMEHSTMAGHDGMNASGMFLMAESSGTGLQPAAWPMPMVMTRLGNWRLMWMGQAFLVET